MPKIIEEHTNVWPEYVKVGIVNYPPGGTLGPRIQPTIELVIIHQGEMTVLVDKKPIHAGANTVTLLFPGHQEYFEFSRGEKTSHSYIHLALPNISSGFKTHLHHLPRTIPLTKDMVFLTERAIALKTSSISTSAMILKNLVTQALWLYIGESEEICSSQDHDIPQRIVESACKYIDTHLQDELTLSDISESVSVCPEHLIRMFKNELSITPIAYLWDRRVSRGIDLLEHSGLSIGMISERCGFKTHNHFSRRVQIATGSSPRKVRQRVWQSSQTN